MAAGSIVIITAINYVGVQSGNLANSVLTVAKVGAARGAAAAGASPTCASIPRSRRSCRPTSLRPLASFGVIMIAVMWTYEGWY